MNSLKTNKSFRKRLKLTRKGRVLKRKPGKNHFNAKESRSKQINKKGFEDFNIKNKELKHYLPYG